MLQELATATGAGGWAIASMFFFIGVWAVIAAKVWRTRPDELAEQARLPLMDEVGNGDALPRGASPRG